MKDFLQKGYSYVVQFKDFGDPVCFRSSSDVGPFMRDNDVQMEWTKKIRIYIAELEAKI